MCRTFFYIYGVGWVWSYDLLNESDLADPDSPFHFVTEYEPQICLTKYEGKTKKKSHFLVDISDPTLPKYRMRNRIKKYLDFYASDDWDDACGEAFPNILIICPTKAIMIYCKRLTKTIIEDRDAEGLNIYFTYEGSVRKLGLTGEIWENIT